MAKGEATRDIAYYEADATGRIVHEAWFEAPYSSMVHDWAVTENFVVFPIIPLTASLERLKAGGPLYVWDGSEDVYLGVVPRKGSTVRWYRGTNRFASHIMNAYDDGRHIHIDTPVGREVRVPVVPRHHRRAVRPGEGQRAAHPVDDRHVGGAGPGRRHDGVRAAAAHRLLRRVPAHRRPLGDPRVPVRVINLTDVPGEKPDDGLPGSAGSARSTRSPGR